MDYRLYNWIHCNECYCPDAYWIIKVFGRKQGIDFNLKNMCELLM